MQAVIGPKDDDDKPESLAASGASTTSGQPNTPGGAYSGTGETSGTDDDNSITKPRGGEPD